MKNIFIKLLSICACITVLTSTAYADIDGIFLGTDTNGINIISDKLQPFNEYKFPILVSVEGAKPTQLTKYDLEFMDVSVRTLLGSKSIHECKVVEENGLCYVNLVPKCTDYINEEPIKLRLNLKSKNENITITPQTRIGFDTMSKSNITQLTNGKAINVKKDKPIFRKSQLNEIDNINDKNTVTFKGENWTYENKITDISSLNLYSSNRVIDWIKEKYPNAELEFLSFPAECKFQNRGKLTVNLDKNNTSFNDNSNLYRYVYGKLYPLGFDYNDELKQVTFSPKELGTYIFSNTKLN